MLSNWMQCAGLFCARLLESANNRKGKKYIRVDDTMEADILRGLTGDIMCLFFLGMYFGICCGGALRGLVR